MRDANRQKAYRAEQSVRRALESGARDGSAAGDVQFASIYEASAFLHDMKRVLADIDPDPELVLEVVQAKNRHTSHYSKWRGEIALSPGWGMTGLVLVHEYTHHTDRPVGYTPDHGGEFCRMFVDNVRRVYAELTSLEGVDKLLAKAFDAQNALWRAELQVKAARKQILRLRSDNLKAERDYIPITSLTFAHDASDFVGATYETWAHGRIDIDSTWNEQYLFQDDWASTQDTIHSSQLRYVEGPMVRWR